jgi:hypothetical protein
MSVTFGGIGRHGYAPPLEEKLNPFLVYADLVREFAVLDSFWPFSHPVKGAPLKVEERGG